MKKTSYFEYNNGEAITNGAFRIGASQVSKFFDTTSQWYHENLLGEEGFTGNTATNLGSVVHAGIEMFVTEGKVDWDVLQSHIDSIDHPEVDNDYITNQYEMMIEAVLPYVQANMPDHVEEFIFHEILPGIGAGGSIDARYVHKKRLKDWKTTSAKTAPTRFSRSYWFQQMTYAWVLKQQGIDIDYIDLVFITTNETGRVSEKTGKPLKDYPSIVSVVTEQVTQESLDLIGSCLRIIAESVDTWNKHPELRHLLAQDSRCKVKPKPITFNKEK
jgi:hypothetical protein